MAHTHEDFFRIFFNSMFEARSLDFFVERLAVFFMKFMPVSAVRIIGTDGGFIQKLSEFSVSCQPLMPETFCLDSKTMYRLTEEEHFFNTSGNSYSVRMSTGEEACIFADLRRRILGTTGSGLYIPLRNGPRGHNLLLLCVSSMGHRRYLQEHVELCTQLQPMLCEVVMSILLGYGLPETVEHDQHTLCTPSPRFLTLDACITEHIRRAIEAADGKVGGPDGAAKLLGLNPSTLWSKIRKYGVAIKKQERV